VAVIAAAVCLAVHVTLARVLCAVPLCLLCPGYAVTAALFAHGGLETPFRVMLALGMSLVTLVLGGVLLNTTGGIYEVSWVVLLLVVIAVASAVAVQRRSPRGEVALPSWRPTRRQVINGGVLAVALVIAVGAVTASRIPLGAPNSVGYETLSIAPLRHDAGVRLEVASARQHTASYELRIYVAQQLVTARRLELAPGDTTAVAVRLPRSSAARTVNASVVLLGGHWTPRRVNLTLPAASA
jgi:hypothetical protein